MIKKILAIILILLSVFLIYLSLKDEKVYYLSLGDQIAKGDGYSYSNYINEQLGENLEIFVDSTVSPTKRTTDIINDISNNISVYTDSTKTMQNVLIKADLITISIGNNDFLDNLNFNYSFSIDNLYEKFDDVYKDFEELFTILRKYSKEKIYFIGFYNVDNNTKLDEFYNYVNSKMIDLCIKYDIEYIDILNDFEERLNYNINNTITNDGYNVIGEKIYNLFKLQ